MLKSVKMHFPVIPNFSGFKNSTNLFMVFRIHLNLKIGTLEIVKNRFRQKENEIKFFEGKWDF